MTKISLAYDLANLQPADANPVEANFTRLEQYNNQEVIERDGSVAMRQPLRLSGDPINALDATPKQYVDNVLPIGIILPFGGSTVPAGAKWLLCDGTEYQSADYPELFAVIGTNYVAGTPSTGRFNVPNMVNRFPMGGQAGTTGGSADAAVINHVHPINHAHPRGTTGNDAPDHAHGDDHQHSGVTAGMDRAGTHHHDNPAIEGQSGGSFGANLVWTQGVDPSGHANWSSGETNTDHLHGFTTNYKSQQGFSNVTAGRSAFHQHQFDVPPVAANSDNPVGGVAATNANLPPYVGVTYLIRAK